MTLGIDATAPDLEVGVVGLGIIAETHLSVLAALPQVTLSFVVDPDPNRAVSFRGEAPPRYERISDALAVHLPDLVVIASPTDTHVELACEALTRSAARVLVEKPLAHDLESLDRIRSLDTSLHVPSRLLVAHHFAFAPEVAWAAGLIAENPAWGSLSRITSVFHDPYVTELDHALASYTSSWIDSGTNQLSMLVRFVDLLGLRSFQQAADGTSSWSTVAFDSGATTGTARLRTSWQAAASSKKTTLELGGSGIELWLDHTAMTGLVVRDGELLHTFGSDSHTPPARLRTIASCTKTCSRPPLTPS